MVVASLSVGVIAFEIASRFILNPADYLSVTTLPDPVLGMTIKPGSAGFDGWGFRNPEVPKSVEIVALGDSHTYGNTAKMRDAWPQVVARETGVSVFNMGLGGYGPNQYYELLTTRALSLHPKQVLVGLYLGDDFENAYSTTYGLEHWSFLRQGARARVDADIWGDPEPAGSLKPLRTWLSSHSVIYRLVVHGQALATLKANLQFRQVSGSEDSPVTMIEVPEDNIREAFRPIRVAAGLDQARSEVREGMRITFHLLEEMNRTCHKNGCRLTVVIIPSKETVFAEFLLHQQHLHLKDVVESLIQNERLATAATKQRLDNAGIAYVETLPALRQSVRNEIYYRGPADMHPSANGYRVIGLAVADYLRAAHDSETQH
jgi:hypothetical protein